mgnify:CR=1 FL=1
MTELFEFMFEKVNIEQVGELLVNLGFSDENIRSVEVIPTFSYIDSRDFCLKVSSFIKTSTEDVSIFINLNHVLFEFPINMIKPSIQIIKYDGNCDFSLLFETSEFLIDSNIIYRLNHWCSAVGGKLSAQNYLFGLAPVDEEASIFVKLN